MAEAAVASLDRIGVRIAELPTLRWDSFGDPQQPTAEFVEDLDVETGNSGAARDAAGGRVCGGTPGCFHVMSSLALFLNAINQTKVASRRRNDRLGEYVFSAYDRRAPGSTRHCGIQKFTGDDASVLRRKHEQDVVEL